jgi:hypothetical protein
MAIYVKVSSTDDIIFGGTAAVAAGDGKPRVYVPSGDTQLLRFPSGEGIRTFDVLDGRYLHKATGWST